MALIEIKDLFKIYGDGENQVLALHNVNLEINKGEFVVILGASGAGKTTLLNILGGMDRLTKGSFEMNGETLNNYNNKKMSLFRRNQIGFVFQFYNLMPNLTALENVKLAQSVAKKGMDSKAALELVGLEHRLNNFPAQLSGGEQQRVAIARAIVKNPTVLLCDEPTGALDSKTGASVLGILWDICRKKKKTTIIVTHNAEIAKIADRIIRIQDGAIIENIIQENPCKVEDLVW